MPPSEVQSLLLDLLRQQTSNIWIVAVVAVGGATLGAFFAGYFRKIGEDRALRENFAEIRAQLSMTTRDTEEIKQRLASHAWRSQQAWSARERYYSQLLTHLHHFKMALSYMLDYYIEPSTEYMPDNEMGEHFHKLQADAATAYTEAQKLLGPAAVFLTSGAVAALEELFKEHWGLANFGAVCTADYVAGAHKLATAAYVQVLSESKCHLGVASDA